LVPPTTIDAAFGDTEIVVKTGAVDESPAATLAPPPHADSAAREIKTSESANAEHATRGVPFKDMQDNLAIKTLWGSFATDRQSLNLVQTGDVVVGRHRLAGPSWKR
jgi:hypothetical protein